MSELKNKRDALAESAQFLSTRDRAFANDLISFFDSRKSWSEKQQYWVDTLTQRGLDNKPRGEQQPLQFLNPNLPPAAPEPVQNLARISQLFQKARDQGLKYPKIRLEAEDGTKVVLRFSGGQFGKPSYIGITDNASYHEGRRYFGRIDLDGRFTKAWQATPEVLKLINQLAEDPVGLAKLYGLKTSTCCFCARPLETSESVTMGYGPICAEKFGLPWGQTKESTYTCLTLEKENAIPDSPGQ